MIKGKIVNLRSLEVEDLEILKKWRNHESNRIHTREFRLLKKHIAKASLLMSGRHLQHGDEKQPERNMEVFTNCATSSTSFLLFYLVDI